MARWEAEQRATAEHQAAIFSKALRERGIDPATITDSKVPIGRISENVP